MKKNVSDQMVETLVEAGIQRIYAGTGGRKMLGSFNHGSMANAMPQAIGAAFACPGITIRDPEEVKSELGKAFL